MGNKKVSQLNTGTTLDGTELVPVVQGGNLVQTTTQGIADLGGGSQSLQDVINVDNHANGEIIKSQSGHSSITLLFDVLTTIISDGLDTTVVEQTPTGLNITSLSITKNSVELATIDIITQTITNGVTDKAPSEDAVYDALAPLLVSSKIFMYKNFK